MKVVVIGGGIAGLEFVRHASKLPIDITLIEPKRRMVCQALLPEFISGKVSEEDVSVEIKPFCDKNGVEFIRDRAVCVENGIVLTEKGKLVEYDLLVVAMGAEANHYGIEGAEKTHSVNTLEDAIKTKKELDKADSVAVVGSGATGVEVACEIAEAYGLEVYLIEYMDRILPAFNPKVSTFVDKILRRDGINVLTSHAVVKVEDNGVVTNSGSLECDVVVWCAGLKPARYLDGINVPKVNGWVAVDGYLRAGERIFAIGDNSFVNVNGKVATKTALEAEMQAKHVAENIKRLMKGEKLKRYKVRSSVDEPIAFITLGKNRAVLVYGRIVLTSPLGLLYRIKKRIVKVFMDKYRV
jgi:NADH dehydrogenase